MKKKNKAVGFTANDVDRLVEGTLPQRRVLNLAPKPVDVPVLNNLFLNSMKIY